MIATEDIYQGLIQEKWEYLIDNLHLYRKEINSEPSLTHAAKTFVSAYLSKIDEYDIKDCSTLVNLEKLWIIDKGNYYKLEIPDLKKVVCQIVLRKEENIFEAYKYAKLFPEEEICRSVIGEYEKLFQTKVNHSQTHRIQVTERKSVSDIDYTINLFKSKQEMEFFTALQKVFDNHTIYPNVAISCLLNWGLLKNDLTQEERDHFFKGIVDFVVFDQTDGFVPLHFFELDSEFHDLDDVKNKDNLKDSIFVKAGLNLKRVRKQSRNVIVEDFVRLLNDLKS